MDLARSKVRAALDATRHLAMELRHAEVRRGLEAVLEDRQRDVVPLSVRPRLLVAGNETRLPPEVRNQHFLILREAIRNAVTHSGCARLTVEMEIDAQRVVGRVEGDGRGFDPEVAGGGTRSMRELVSSTVDTSPAPNGGTRVGVTAPLEEG